MGVTCKHQLHKVAIKTRPFICKLWVYCEALKLIIWSLFNRLTFQTFGASSYPSINSSRDIITALIKINPSQDDEVALSLYFPEVVALHL